MTLQSLKLKQNLQLIGFITFVLTAIFVDPVNKETGATGIIKRAKINGRLACCNSFPFDRFVTFGGSAHDPENGFKVDSHLTLKLFHMHRLAVGSGKCTANKMFCFSLR